MSAVTYGPWEGSRPTAAAATTARPARPARPAVRQPDRPTAVQQGVRVVAATVGVTVAGALLTWAFTTGQHLQCQRLQADPSATSYQLQRECGR